MGVIFAKTDKGLAELTLKSGGLTPRQRRVLIMVDGKRSVEELRELLQNDDLQHTLGILEESGFRKRPPGRSRPSMPSGRCRFHPAPKTWNWPATSSRTH